MLTIEDYSDKAIIVKGNVEPFKDKLEELKGSWNNTIKGYFFPKNKKEKIEELIKKVEKKEIKPKNNDNEKKYITNSEYLSLITRIEKLELAMGMKEKFGTDIIHIETNKEKNNKKDKKDKNDEKEFEFIDEEENKPRRLLRKGK